MKTNALRSALAMLTFAYSAFASFAEAREFTDSKGRKIEAEIVASAGGDKIIIATKGKEFPVPINMFSLDDQVFIKKWIEDHPDAKRIDARFSYFIDLERDHSDSKETKSLQSRLQKMNWTYDFSITNKGETDLENLRIAYMIVIEDIVDANGNYNKMAYTNEKADMKLQRIVDETPVALLPSQKRADIKKSFSVEKYVDRDGSAVGVSAQDTLIGLWIRIYSGDQLLGEYQRPVSGESMKDISWSDESGRSPTAKIR